jgi:hypothetical protein
MIRFMTFLFLGLFMVVSVKAQSVDDLKLFCVDKKPDSKGLTDIIGAKTYSIASGESKEWTIDGTKYEYTFTLDYQIVEYQKVKNDYTITVASTKLDSSGNMVKGTTVSKTFFANMIMPYKYFQPYAGYEDKEGYQKYISENIINLKGAKKHCGLYIPGMWGAK